MNDLLTQLNDQQREAVFTTEGPLLVIAGAGSGKTKALTHRIAYLIGEKKVSPWNILAVTFTNKAAQAMKERVIKLIGQDTPVTIGTFHAVCARILRKHAHLLEYENAFTIYDTTDQELLMKRLMEERSIDAKKMNPRAILNAISGAKNQLITAKEYQQYVNSHFTEKVAELYGPYQKALLLNGAMDFDDLLMKTVELFRTQADVLHEYQERFKYISVDEYQDTNHSQYVLVKLLAARYKNLCVIGDEDQSIYSWRGATIQNILDFEKDYPDARVIKLEQNYRSTQQILDAAHHIISLNTQRKEKRLWTEEVEGEKLCIWTARNERAEAEMVAEEILRSLQRYESPDYHDFVVLYRTNAQSRNLEEVFLRYGIPYKIIGGIKFYDRKEIKDMLAYLRVIVNPRDSLSLLRILNVPARNIGTKTIEALQSFATISNVSLFSAMERVNTLGVLSDTKVEAIGKFVDLIHELQGVNRENTAAAIIKHVLEKTKYKAFLDDGTSEGSERLENVRELISVAKKYDGLEAGMSLKVFLEEVSLIADADSIDEKENSVMFMTMHAAKGLEFTNVFAVGLEEGIFPNGRSILERDLLEEERRLMYVAITRAKERLYLLHAQERLLYGEYRNNAPSQFLEEIPEELVERNVLGDGAFGPRQGRQSHLRSVAARSVAARKKPQKSSVGPRRSSEPILAKNPRPVPIEKIESDFRDGDRVFHAIFGQGVVLNLVGGIITVVFENPEVGVKKLAVSIAPLKKSE